MVDGIYKVVEVLGSIERRKPSPWYLFELFSELSVRIFVNEHDLVRNFRFIRMIVGVPYINIADGVDYTGI